MPGRMSLRVSVSRWEQGSTWTTDMAWRRLLWRDSGTATENTSEHLPGHHTAHQFKSDAEATEDFKQGRKYVMRYYHGGIFQFRIQ